MPPFPSRLTSCRGFEKEIFGPASVPSDWCDLWPICSSTAAFLSAVASNWLQERHLTSSQKIPGGPLWPHVVHPVGTLELCQWVYSILNFGGAVFDNLYMVRQPSFMEPPRKTCGFWKEQMKTKTNRRFQVWDLGPAVVPFYPFLGEGSPTKIDYREKGTPILTSRLLEDLATEDKDKLNFQVWDNARC